MSWYQLTHLQMIRFLQMLTSLMEGEDSKPADDDDREGVAEGQHGQGLLQHGLQINVVPELGIFVFLTGFRSHDINIKLFTFNEAFPKVFLSASFLLSLIIGRRCFSTCWSPMICIFLPKERETSSAGQVWDSFEGNPLLAPSYINNAQVKHRQKQTRESQVGMANGGQPLLGSTAQLSLLKAR